MHRRSFLTSAGLGALGLWLPKSSLGRETSRLATSRSSSAGPYRILEIVLAGGLSPFDTFLWSPQYTTSTVGAITAALPSSQQGATRLGPGHHYLATGLESHFRPYATDAQGTNPFYRRWRAICLGHDLLPHEAALPFALTGTTLGRAYHSGMGAAMKKQHGATDAEPAYILYDNDVSAALLAAQVQGLGGQYYPVLAPGGVGGMQAARYNRSPRTADPLVDALRGQYDARLAGTRSDSHDAYEAARQSLEQARVEIHPELQAADAATSGSTDIGKLVRVGLQLLRNGDARYVATIQGGYDTHGTQLTSSTPGQSHWEKHQNLLKQAMDGVMTMSSADLDNIMVVITTEFGRHFNGDSAHWPYGYVNMVLGGPVGSGSSTQYDAELRLRGHMDFNGHAYRNTPGDRAWGPGELRAAVLHAAGVDVSALFGPSSNPFDLTTSAASAYADLLL